MSKPIRSRSTTEGSPSGVVKSLHWTDPFSAGGHVLGSSVKSRQRRGWRQWSAFAARHKRRISPGRFGICADHFNIHWLQWTLH